MRRTPIITLFAAVLALVACPPTQNDPALYGSVSVYVDPGWFGFQSEWIDQELGYLGALGPTFHRTAARESADVVVLPAAFEDCQRNGAGRWIVGTRVVEVDPVCTPGEDAFRAAIGHEIGHALGLSHVCTASDLDVPGDPCSPVGRGVAMMNPRLRSSSGSGELFDGAQERPTALDLLEFQRVRAGALRDASADR